MGNCSIKNPPVFTKEVIKWDKSTKDNGEEMAIPIEEIFNNTIYNKAEIEKLAGKMLAGITISISGWSDLTFTVSDVDIKATSRVVVSYAFDSIPIAQRANIRGKLETGKLVLVASKLPTEDLVVEEIQIINLI